jgi:hypothetical protein
MKRILVAAAAWLVLCVPSMAADLERKLESRWRGAWVVTTVETYSDCLGVYNNNDINGRLVSSRGRVRFEAGELAKVDKVDAKRARLELRLSLAEPLLLSHQDGPFTLHDEVGCRVEMDVGLSRDLVRGDDIAGIEKAVAEVIERYPSAQEARRAKAWNRRVRDPYPPDYTRTLAEHAAWKVRQQNDLVQARLDKALEATSEVTSGMSPDPAYLTGFARGVEAARLTTIEGCPEMLALDLAGPRRTVERASSRSTDDEKRVDRGFEDGRRLVLGLGLLRHLPRCFVPIPEPPADPRAGRAD